MGIGGHRMSEIAKQIFTINLSNIVFYSIGFLIGYFARTMKG